MVRKHLSNRSNPQSQKRKKGGNNCTLAAVRSLVDGPCSVDSSLSPSGHFSLRNHMHSELAVHVPKPLRDS